jgi:anti-sigma B factor antagonist
VPELGPPDASAEHVEQHFWVEEERPAGNGVVVLSVHGDVDLHVAPELRDRLTSTIDDGADYVVVDLSRVTFMDSMALGVLLGALKLLRPRGGEMRIVMDEGAALRRIFEITLLDQVFTLETSRQAALAELIDPWG